MNKKNKITVLVGGCFDVLHPGHIIFLERAKKAGDTLIVLLESDQKIRKIKGINRPVHNQKERELVLKALKSVDKVILLPFINSELEYNKIIQKIKPNIIATTEGDSQNHYKARSAKLVGAKLKYVTKLIGTHSTSRILTH